MNRFHLGSIFLALAFLSTAVLAQRGGHGHGSGIASGAPHPGQHHGLHSGKSKDKVADSKKTKENTHSNKGGAVRGKERAEEVQGTHKKADANRGFTTASGVEKAEAKTTTKSANSQSKEH